MPKQVKDRSKIVVATDNSASIKKAREFSHSLNEHLRGADSRLQVQFLHYSENGEYAIFDVLGHNPWPGIDECKQIAQVKVDNEIAVHASGACLDLVFHGTHASNAFSILKGGGFNIECSGDTPAGVCTAPKFHATSSYDHGAVLHCSIHGVVLSCHTSEKRRAFDTWVGRYTPIGANLYNKHKGSKLGQVISHPGNLCIERLSLKKKELDSTISTTWIPGACYGNKNPLDAYHSLANERSANGIESPKDFRDLRMPGIIRCFNHNPIVVKSFIASILIPGASSNDLRQTKARSEPSRSHQGDQVSVSHQEDQESDDESSLSVCSTDTQECRPPSVASTQFSCGTQRDGSRSQTPPHASFFSQFGEVVRRPISLKFEEGDRRFATNKQRDRTHICDACNLLFQYRGKVSEFDGEFRYTLPKGPTTQRYWNWFYGYGDYTWLCTSCLFEECREFDTLDEFRDWLLHKKLAYRGKRTKSYQNGEKFRNGAARRRKC